MLNYEKLSRSTRTRTAILLLLLYMVLAIADLFISFFGGVLLGVLLMQFEVEVQKFFKKTLKRASSTTGLLKHYNNLIYEQKILIKAGLQVIVTILILTGVLATFWGGIVSGMLLALLANDIIMIRRKRLKLNARIKKNQLKP
ncbi:hypothetical protein ABID22_001394 [Pontibacter aydingkolensis]|uniref:ATP synthase I chain n=1 Tax=Pontibacter aydingkolensis TaxID=1911536 RepID=A0ABS7CNZ7_9BACT|nr:hypothetical protein [Pontibacter aydingkolensis]MBW7465558.1 hypothetical protein [Pontibacter aydingkolensis]